MQFNDISVAIAKKLLSASDRQRIWLKMSKLLSNGVPIVQALTSLRDRKAKMSGDSDFAVIAMNQWLTKMGNGSGFADAVSEWIPHQEYLLLVAGERSGDLAGSLVAASDVIGTIKQIKGAVRAGLLYPLVMLTMALGISYMFGVKIFPQFFKIAAEDKWGGMAVYAIKFSHFVQDYMLYVVMGFMALIFVFFLSLPRWSDGLRVKLDGFLPFSLYRTVVGSTWLISLAAMISAGERIEDALENMKKGSGKWLQKRIDACLREMRSGHNMGDSLARTGYNFPDPEIIDDLGVYSSVSGFDEALDALGREWSTESVAKVQASGKAIFGVGVLCVAVLLAFLMGGLISMELQLGDVIKRH